MYPIPFQIDPSVRFILLIFVYLQNPELKLVGLVFNGFRLSDAQEKLGQYQFGISI